MLIITDADIMAAVHQNHEAAANREVIYIPVHKSQPEEPHEDTRELNVYQGEKLPWTPPAYIYGTVFRFGLGFGFAIASNLELIHPALGGTLAAICGIWAVCYAAVRKWGSV